MQLKTRFLKFYRSLSASENGIIRYLSRLNTFSNNSVMSNNLNQILYDLDLDIHELEKVHLSQNIKYRAHFLY